MAGTLTLRKYLIDRDKFKEASEQEQVFFIKAMNVLTELEILQKGLIFSTNPILFKKLSMSSLKTTAHNIQSLYFARILAGILNEASELLNEAFFSSKKIGAIQLRNLRPEYYAEFDNAEQAALDRITKFFTDEKILHVIRNQFAFHFDVESAFTELDMIRKEATNELYFADSPGNCLFTFADQCLILALAKQLGYEVSSLGDAIDKFMAAVTTMAKDFTTFLFGFKRVFLQKHLGIDAEKCEDIEVHEVPDLADVELPYFTLKT